MHYSLTLLFLLGAQICMATPLLPDTVSQLQKQLLMAEQYQLDGATELAIQEYEKLKPLLIKEQNNVQLVHVLHQLASLYTQDKDDFIKAQDCLESAELILDQTLFENDSLRAQNWLGWADYYYAQRQFDKAISQNQKAVERMKSVYGKDHMKVANGLELIADIYLYDLQNYSGAASAYHEARTIREDLDSLDRHYYNIIYSLAYAYRLKGDYDKALADGFTALAYYQSNTQADNKDFLANQMNTVFTYGLIGSAYFGMDSMTAALKYNSMAIHYAADNHLLSQIDMSLHYNNQAEYYYKTDLFDSTIHYAQRAIAQTTRERTLSSSYQFLANGYLGKGQMEQAFHYYAKSRQLKESLWGNFHPQLAWVYIFSGRAFEANQQLDSALFYFKKALISARISQDSIENVDFSVQIGDDLGTMQEALMGISDVLSAQYQQSQDIQCLTASLPYFKLFDRIMDMSRSDFSTESSKLILSGKYKTNYERAIATNFELYQQSPADSLLEDIFYFMEKSKAMVLLESIHQARQYRQTLPDSLLDEFQTLRTEVAHIQSEIMNVHHTADTGSVSADLQRKKAVVLGKMEQLNRRIQADYPNYYDVSYRDLTIRLDSLQQQIEDDKQVISYFWGKSAVYAMKISSEDVQLHKIDEMDALTEAIGKYRSVLLHDEVFQPSYHHFVNYQTSALYLYQQLLQPLIHDTHSRHLTIVPDGELTSIPFDSFITDSLENALQYVNYAALPYLIQKSSISYAFSLSIAYQDAGFQQAELEGEPWKIYAYGIKDFSTLSDQKYYPPLAGAEREIQHIKDVFSDTEIFLNNHATESHFKQYASQADVLHIATHGIADFENPFASRFIFYPEGEEDGIFHLYEIYDTPMKARLLLLSACQSGVGKYYAGEGSFSLARSFMYAGCKSILMTLWEISDIAAERLINGIYDRLADEQTIEDAVRNTKLAVIDSRMHAHPKNWAGMIPMGATQVEFPTSHLAVYIIAAVVLLLIMLSALYYFTKVKTQHGFKIPH